MQGLSISVRAWAALASLTAMSLPPTEALAAKMKGDAAATCSGLAGAADNAVKIDSAAMQPASPLAVAEKSPTPLGRITPANPEFCKVLGRIEPTDPNAPPIRFQVNLPIEWNGRSLQYGGGGFNGVLISGLALPPASPFGAASPLARGFVTYGTDSGHETKPGEPPQLFALNDEAFENFAHKSYKKVRDAAAALMVRAYGNPPAKLYFMGSSEGGREGLTMAQRYADDFDGIFARVPVINWAGLQHAGTTAGLATMGDGWIRPAQVELVAKAVLAACDKADGLADQLVQDPVGCKAKFKPEALRCNAGQSGDDCLSEPQIAAIKALHATYKFPFPLANGLDDYPGWGVSGENTPSFGPTGGWKAWWLGFSRFAARGGKSRANSAVFSLPSLRRSRSDGAEGRGARVRNAACAAALPVARLAALSGGASQSGEKFLLRAVVPRHGRT